MANGVNIKMGVSGVAQFKQNMNQAKQSLKTVDEQLKLNEKQFQATGDKETYLQQKAELLNVKLQEQKAILANAEKALEDMTNRGVDKASKAYQEMQRQVLQAKGNLIDTESAMNGITVAGDDAAKSVDSMNQQLKSIGSQISLETVSSGIKGITGGLEAATKKALQLARIVVRGSMESAAYADDILTRASKYGEGYDAELVQQMDNVSAYIDTDTDTIINAQKKLKKAMGATSNAETMGAFAALGIDPNNTKWQDVFWLAGEKLKGLTNDIEREEYATKLFGRSWDELNPLFDAGREKYEQMLSEQTVLTNAQVEALGKQDDAMQKMQQQIDLLKNQFFAGLAPAITDATNALSGLLEKFNQYLQTEKGQEMLTNMGNAVSGLFDDLSKIDPDKVIEGFSGAFNTITDGFKWLYENKQGIITAMEGIVMGWGTLKLAGGALDVMKFVGGIKGLSAPGAAASAAAAGAEVGAAAGSSWAAAFGSAALKAVPWLAGFGILFENAFKPQGNDDLIDENGELTALGQSVENQTALPGAGSKYNAWQIEQTQALWDKYRNGEMNANTLTDFRTSTVMADDLYGQLMNSIYRFVQETPGWRDVTDLPDTFFQDNTSAMKDAGKSMDKAADTMEKAPDKIAAAVAKELRNIHVDIDGQRAGRILTPYISQNMAEEIQ